LDDLKLYDVGDKAIVDARFEVDDVATDPALVSAKVRKPDGTIENFVYGTDSELGKSSVGVYFLEIACDEPGIWWYSITGNEPAPGSVRGAFSVLRSPLDPGWPNPLTQLCQLEDVKLYAGIDLADRRWDEMLLDMIEEVGELFATVTGREFVARGLTFDVNGSPEPQVRVFAADEVWWPEERTLALGDLHGWTDPLKFTDYEGTTVIAVPSNAWSPLHPDGSADPRLYEPWCEIRLSPNAPTPIRGGWVELIGNWGFQQVPPPVRRFAIVQVSEWYARDVAKFSTTFDLADGRLHRPRTLSPAIEQGLMEGWALKRLG
jgi:hypothetical protein